MSIDRWTAFQPYIVVDLVEIYAMDWKCTFTFACLWLQALVFSIKTIYLNLNVYYRSNKGILTWLC